MNKMKLETFKREFKYLNYIRFDGFLFIRHSKRKYEIYNEETEEQKFFKNIDETLNYEICGKTIKQWIELRKDNEFEFNGGSGASSGKKQSSLFGGQAGGAEEDKTINDLPAYMNKLYNGNKMSQENTVEVFRKKHANSDSEHAIVYDDNGFVSTYKHGNKHSVTFGAEEVAGKHMIHNHPSGSHFSKADLDSFASTKMNGLSATTKTKTYTITKTNKFNASGFGKAVNKAKTVDKDYNTAVDRFLKANAKKYGYKYTTKGE